ncbi:NmrA family NAD(P)-binding protein [Rugamonas apoptosis]|nr:NmrA family NAD(P)-binding protein [Rugamonas apoptosis]
MSKKILVLGATGNVGRPLVQALLRKGEQVKATVQERRRSDLISRTIQTV